MADAENWSVATDALLLAAQLVERWRTTLGEPRFWQLRQALRAIVQPGPLRPGW